MAQNLWRLKEDNYGHTDWLALLQQDATRCSFEKCLQEMLKKCSTFLSVSIRSYPAR